MLIPARDVVLESVTRRRKEKEAGAEAADVAVLDRDAGDVANVDPQ
jgi:hypothetical protein